MRILIVEDNPRIAAFLRKGLAEEGYSVETAADGDEAYAKGKDQDFDAAIVDVMLPGRNGVELVRPMTQERDERRAVLEPWLCSGALDDGRPCRKVLMELDMARPSFIRKVCERCKYPNLFVEAYRPFDR